MLGKTPKKGRPTPKRDNTKNTYSHRNKALNTPEFNKKAKARREKAKFDSKARKINRKR